jgi:hypothetical protein
MLKPPTLDQLTKQVKEWNLRVPTGSTVKYHPVIGEKWHYLLETSGPAYVLSGHTAVVHLKGKSGCVAIAACEPYGTANAKPSAEPNSPEAKQ